MPLGPQVSQVVPSVQHLADFSSAVPVPPFNVTATHAYTNTSDDPDLSHLLIVFDHPITTAISTGVNATGTIDSAGGVAGINGGQVGVARSNAVNCSTDNTTNVTIGGSVTISSIDTGVLSFGSSGTLIVPFTLTIQDGGGTV